MRKKQAIARSWRKHLYSCWKHLYSCHAFAQEWSEKSTKLQVLSNSELLFGPGVEELSCGGASDPGCLAHHLLAVQPYADDLTSLCLSVLSYKLG